MKRKELLTLWDVLSRLEENKYNLKFSYFIAKTKLIIRDEIELLNKARTPMPEYIKFDNERLELVKEYSDKDGSGRPIIENNNYIIKERVEEFNIKINDLLKQYDIAIKDFEKKLEEYTTLMNGEYTGSIKQIKYEDLPDSIEPNILEVLIKCNLIQE